MMPTCCQNDINMEQQLIPKRIRKGIENRFCFVDGFLSKLSSPARRLQVGEQVTKFAAQAREVDAGDRKKLDQRARALPRSLRPPLRGSRQPAASAGV